MMASDHASKNQGLSSLPTARWRIQEPHPLLVITLVQILAKKRPSFISTNSLIHITFLWRYKHICIQDSMVLLGGAIDGQASQPQ